MSILNPLYEAVAWVLMRIHALLALGFGADSGVSWCLSIVLLVVVLRVIMLPLFVKQVRAQQRMQQHMPQLQEIRRKYKNDKQRLNEETMKYYKENGVNPLSGCLPLLAQFPVFISLFNVLRAIAQGHEQYGLTQSVIESAKHAHVFGVLLSDTFLHGNTPWGSKAVILASVLISAGTTFLTMYQSKRRGMLQQGPVDPDNPMANTQKYMMYITPLFALSGLYWQYGLVIYWVTNNLWTLGQQFFLFRNLPVVGSATVGGAAEPPRPAGSKAQATVAATRNSATSTKAASAGASSASGRPAAGTKGAPAGKAAPEGKAAPAGKSAAKGAPAIKPAPTGRAAQAAKPAAKPSQPAQPSRPAQPATAGARASVNGSAANGSSSEGGAKGLKLFGKAKPEPEPAVPQKVTVRQQPARQTRSKRKR